MADSVRAGATAAPRKSGGRVHWVDSAKGLCILLVVLGHAVTELGNHGYSTGIWDQVNFMLGPIRMPLFFLLSGLFAAKALTDSWHRLADRRIWVMVWLYVLWVPLRDVVMASLPRSHVTESGLTAMPPILDPANWPALAFNSLHAAVEPTSYLWFLWALALFAILTKAMRRIPPLIQIGVAAAINVWAPFASSSWSWDFVSKMFVFYLLGMYGAPMIFRMVARRPVGFLLASASSYVAVVAWIMLNFPTFNDGNQGVVRLFLSLAGVFAAVNIMAMLQGNPVVAPFERIGRRTLPVFLMHIPILAILAIVADQFLMADPGLPLQPVIATVIAAALSLGLHRLLIAVGGEWLFKRPAWFVRLTMPTARPSGGEAAAAARAAADNVGGGADGGASVGRPNVNEGERR